MSRANRTRATSSTFFFNFFLNWLTPFSIHSLLLLALVAVAPTSRLHAESYIDRTYGFEIEFSTPTRVVSTGGPNYLILRLRNYSDDRSPEGADEFQADVSVDPTGERRDQDWVAKHWESRETKIVRGGECAIFSGKNRYPTALQPRTEILCGLKHFEIAVVFYWPGPKQPSGASEALESISLIGQRLDTPRRHLSRTLKEARHWSDDAQLGLVYAASSIDARGHLYCRPQFTTPGWEFTFFSAREGTFLRVRACDERVWSEVVDKNNLHRWKPFEEQDAALPLDFLDSTVLPEKAQMEWKRKKEEGCGHQQAPTLKMNGNVPTWTLDYYCREDKHSSRRVSIHATTGKIIR